MPRVVGRPGRTPSVQNGESPANGAWYRLQPPAFPQHFHRPCGKRNVRVTARALTSSPTQPNRASRPSAGISTGQRALSQADPGWRERTSSCQISLDAIASHGVRFQNHYVATAMCSPSLATFLTGQLPQVHHVMDQMQYSFVPTLNLNVPQKASWL